MIKYQCDRCGKEIEYKDKVDVGLYRNKPTETHLCLNCYEGLLQYLKVVKVRWFNG